MNDVEYANEDVKWIILDNNMEPKRNYCAFCGTSLFEPSNFCSQCGTKQTDIKKNNGKHAPVPRQPPPPPLPRNQPSPVYRQQPAPPVPNGRKTIQQAYYPPKPQQDVKWIILDDNMEPQ